MRCLPVSNDCERVPIGGLLGGRGWTQQVSGHSAHDLALLLYVDTLLLYLVLATWPLFFSKAFYSKQFRVGNTEKLIKRKPY